MSTHEIAIKENTGATRADVPFLGRYVVKGNVDGTTVIAKVAAEAKLTDTVARAIVEGTFDAIAEEEREGLTKFNLGPFTVCAVVTGSFPSSDAAFDSERNRLLLAVKFDDKTRLCLADITPAIVTDATATKVRIDTVTDVATPRPYSVIHGRKPFKCQGYNLVMTDAGAYIRLVNKSGQNFECIVDETGGRGFVIAHTAELLEPGDYKVVIGSRGGDAEGSLQTARRNVKYLRVEGPPSLTLTGVHAPGIEPPMIHLESGVWFDGTGLDGWTGGENDEILGKNNRAEEAEWTRLDLHEDIGGEVVFDGGMLKMDEGAWTLLENLGIVEGSEVRFQVKIAGQTAEIVATVAEA